VRTVQSRRCSCIVSTYLAVVHRSAINQPTLYLQDSFIPLGPKSILHSGGVRPGRTPFITTQNPTAIKPNSFTRVNAKCWRTYLCCVKSFVRIRYRLPNITFPSCKTYGIRAYMLREKRFIQSSSTTLHDCCAWQSAKLISWNLSV